MRFSLAAALFFIAPALRAEEAGLAGLLREPPAVAAQAAVKALPTEAQLELFTLYARYNEVVSKRMDEGWRVGLLSDEGTKVSQDDTLPARQLEEAVRSRETEVKSLAKQVEQPEVENGARLRRELAAAQLRLAALRGALARSKGTCLDWSDLVWAELGRLKPEHWSIQDRERAGRPFHTGAVLCSPPASEEEPVCSDSAPGRCLEAGRQVCLVFDPWQRGQADVYELGAWDGGRSAGRVPADFFLHDLPEPRPARARKARR
ncbi:MAG: hypothetical protein NTY77_18405 [Elusimicrobia bacterium]|nr:hypothetical protein [Elusimicrobiota bacterium]